MTRINTNVSSLVAQNRLTKTNTDLQTSLTRLSTGLRINSGKDDPAGLIASEALRSDITSINKAISNTQRASQIIATADSALGQVSSLLNDVRGLVTEAANNGALSDDEIAANQLQIDSSLEAINRIAQTTTFQGRRLLDGSLDFVTKAGTGFGNVKDLQIDQANLGATGSVSVNVNITAAATKASVNVTSLGIPASTTASTSSGSITLGTSVAATEAVIQVDLANSFNIGSEATATLNFTNAYTIGAQASTSSAITLASGVAFNAAAVDGGAADGLKGNSTVVNITTVAAGAGTLTTGSYDANTNELNLVLEEGETGAAIEAALDTALAGIFTFTDATGAPGTQTVTAGDATAISGRFTNGTNPTAAAALTLTAVNGGPADGATGSNTDIVFTSGGTTAAAYDATQNRLTVTVAAGATINQIANAINNGASTSGVFNATNITNGTSIYSTSDTASLSATTLSAVTNPTAASQFRLVATDGGPADGIKANTTSVVFSSGASTAATYDATSNELRVTVASGATIQQIIDAIDAEPNNVFQSTGSPLNATAKFSSTDLGTVTPTVVTAGTNTTVNDVITVTSKKSSTAYNKNISFVAASNSVTPGTVRASINSTTGNIELQTHTSGTVSLAAIRDAINSLDDYSATITANNGDGLLNIGTDTPTIVNLTGGSAGGGLNDDLVIQLSGSSGSEVFQFQKGASLASIVQSINLVKDGTGIEAVNDSGNLKLTSQTYGSKSLVAVEVISEGANGTFKNALSATRSNGTDVQATINGYAATGDGNTLSLNTATLDLKLTVVDGSSSAINFDITGGGALFQLGSDVVSNQQARLGIASLNTAKLGSSNGRLYELASGGSKSLRSDATGAFKVIDDVINKVTSLRGRLGAFQSTTLESNTASLTDTVANLTEAESSIRDADFAQESAKLTRAQILVQSGTQVLALANQNPQNVLSLLR